MAGVLLDTHSWAWALTTNPNLTLHAMTAMGNATFIAVSPISLYEVAQKVRLGRWPEMTGYAVALEQAVKRQGFVFAEMNPAIATRAGLLDWDHRDPFDRILAATALAGGMDFISADTAFDTIPGLRRIW
ncbi:MAG: regulation and Cell signaling [Cypionkella sp.]|uniref:type II toxin-antitoxin system VapC family toxin n=1 Tax=Cypionkella sp. TaxID=2811411 RepID=UPI00260F24FA|nr:type II toxin-antitoxin system VapC family toxin [Cypionkella sp.]MDB5659141.1 regulation and Cell signaling [Cypionkella sp.]